MKLNDESREGRMIDFGFSDEIMDTPQKHVAEREHTPLSQYCGYWYACIGYAEVVYICTAWSRTEYTQTLWWESSGGLDSYKIKISVLKSCDKFGILSSFRVSVAMHHCRHRRFLYTLMTLMLISLGLFLMCLKHADFWIKCCKKNCRCSNVKAYI